MKVSANIEQPQKKKQYYIGETIAASTVAGAASLVTAPISLGVMKGIHKIGKLPADKVEIMHKAAEQAIKDTGLAAKGLKIEYLQKPPINLGGMLKFIKDPIKQIEAGYNGKFTQGLTTVNGQPQIFQSILMPQKDVSFLAFHEIGHAMNNNFSKIGKFIQHARNPLMILASLVAIYGACSTKSKPKDGEKLTVMQKTNNFIRNNAGKLSFGLMLPVLAEEGIATLRGNNLAKKLLSPDMLKIVKKGNAIAFLSYLGTAAGVGLGAWAAVKIKDKLVERKQNKINS